MVNTCVHAHTNGITGCSNLRKRRNNDTDFTNEEILNILYSLKLN